MNICHKYLVKYYIKSTAKIYAPVKTIKYNKNTYYKIKALDSHRNPITNVMLKVKVFTGKKYRNYSIKTTSRGIAKFETGGLSLGNHIITIKSPDKKYKIFKSTKIIIRKTVAKKAEKLIVSAPAENVNPDDENYKALLTWYSKPGASYQVLKKNWSEL